MMLALGPYRFAINTSSYQSLRRSSSYRWPAVERIGAMPALQHIGADSGKISLDGVIYPDNGNESSQVARMRDSAKLSTPHLLVDGQGYVWGKWVIEKIDEQQSYFFENGSARKIEFHLELTEYGDNL